MPARVVRQLSGEASGVVSFGGERVREQVAVQGFFNSGGGVIFQIVGHPGLARRIRHAHLCQRPLRPDCHRRDTPDRNAARADAASAEQFKIKIGAAFKRGNKLVSFSTLPSTCKGHLTGKAEVSFYSGETVPIEVSVPCPKRKK